MISDIFSKSFWRFEEIEHEINRDDLICKAANNKKDKKGQVIFGSFGRGIYCGIFTLDDVFEKQANLKE